MVITWLISSLHVRMRNCQEKGWEKEKGEENHHNNNLDIDKQQSNPRLKSTRNVKKNNYKK